MWAVHLAEQEKEEFMKNLQAVWKLAQKFIELQGWMAKNGLDIEKIRL
jgi:hypothetical protein